MGLHASLPRLHLSNHPPSGHADIDMIGNLTQDADMVLDETRLRTDLKITAFNGWFECGDRFFPKTFENKVDTQITTLLRSVLRGVVSLDDAYYLARDFGQAEHQEFYGPAW